MMGRWQGRGASPGVVAGVAHVIREDRDLIGAAPGRIVITRHATPDVYPALVQADAAVCETGGLFCHLAVLARELGKPCVTGVTGIIDALRTGDSLCVDGARGVVVSRSAADPPAPSGPELGSIKVPVVQFGQFSAAFALVHAAVDVEAAVRIAAFVSMPRAFRLGPAWDFEIDGNRVLVEAESLRSTADELSRRLETGVLDAEKLGSRYDELCRSGVWPAVAEAGVGGHPRDLALRHYVELNHITWAAIIAKDPLADRYQRFLSERLPNADPAWLHEAFLDTIVLPGRSYILRLWSGAAPEAAPQGVGWQAGGATLDGVDRRRRAALDQLTQWVSRADASRIRRYLAALGVLVDVAERKNADLVRCGRALFAGEASRRAIADRLGIGHRHLQPPDSAGDQRIVAQVARRLCDDLQ